MSIDRRDFFKTAAAGVAAAGFALSPGLAEAPLGAKADAKAGQAPLKPMSEKDKLLRIASCSCPIRSIFKTRGQGNPQSQELKKKYGEITMLDFPQWTKDTFPGVTHMDIFSGLFGDVTDDSMFAQRPGGGPGTFDPSSAVGTEVAGEARREAGGHRREDASTSRTTRRPTWPRRTMPCARPASTSARSGSTAR